MNAALLLEWCRDHGVHLTPHGEKLHWAAPPGVVSDSIQDSLRQYKRELLDVLMGCGPSQGYLIGCANPPQSKAFERARWLTGTQLQPLPETIQGLVCEREGWSPASWAEYLIYKANRCRDLYPAVAEKYEFAASLLHKGGH